RCSWALLLRDAGRCEAEEELRRAAAEADRAPSEPTEQQLIGLARWAVRGAVQGRVVEDLPHWAVADLPEEHLPAVNAILESGSWAEIEEALREHRQLVGDPGFHETVHVLR